MWISKKERDNILSSMDAVQRERDEWKAKYKAATENTMVSKGGGAVIISLNLLKDLNESAEQAEVELNTLRAELESWKQKYADEVQKRLALIKQMEGMPNEQN